jgi:hypothetical protein
MSGANAPDVEPPGIDRRTLIKRAAATGAVAWTAPLILDSLASPAAAVTAGGRWEFQTVSPCVTGGDNSTGAGAGTACNNCTGALPVWTSSPSCTALTGWSTATDRTGGAVTCGATTTASLSAEDCAAVTRVRSQVLSVSSPCTFLSAAGIRFQLISHDGCTYFQAPSCITSPDALITVNNATNPRTVTFNTPVDEDQYWAVFRVVTTC